MPATPVSPDFRAFFESAPDAYLVLGRDFRIAAVSDAYLRATRTRREDIVGRGVFEVFPDNPDDPRATGVTNLRRSLERVLGERRADAMPVQKYDIRRPEAEGGGFEERYWRLLNTPVIGDDGEVRAVIHRVEDVTAQIRAERQTCELGRRLQEVTAQAVERHQALLDSAPDAMIVVDERTRIEFVNVQAEKMFGWTRAELVGQPLEVLIPARLREAHAGHVARFFAEPGTRPMGRGIELTGLRRDGAEISIEVSLSPLRVAEGLLVSAAIRDVSERKRVEAERRLAAERLTSAVESIQDAFALFDAEDRLIQCNSVYRRLLDDELPGQLVGRPYREVLEAWSRTLAFADEADRVRFCEARFAQRHDNRAAYDVRTRDDRNLRVVDRRTPEGGLVKMVWDITEDVRREKELRLAQQLAEEGNAAKTEFLSSMSHELRTPLNAILGFAQLLLRDRKAPLHPRQEARVGHIIKGGEHLLRLIDDILDLSRIEGRNVSISIEPVGVAEVLREVLTTIEPMAARAGIEIAPGTTIEPSPLVEVDRTRFAQILMNFASNAVKYNHRGGWLRFDVTRPGPDRIRVTVTDNGIGIPLDKQSKVFQPFQRAGQETGPIEGTGIGLAISKRLAEMMRGAIGFESTPGEGSSFWIEVPAHVAAAPVTATEEVVRLDPSALAATDGGRVVLYVEDNPANIEFMKELLGVFDDIELLVAPTAELGIAVARQRRPDAIIMDINLPGMSGLDALRELRALPETSHIPVIALTAAASERDRERGEQVGFYRYLTKPVKVAELEAALAKLLVPAR
ncbi:MAG TPA: PAS domain S-box protein [Nannocystis sp.]